MGVGAALRAFAFRTPTGFPVLGLGGRPVWRRHLLTSPIRPTRAPHDADLLVLAGEIPKGWAGALSALFETMALPRAAVWLPPPWPSDPPQGVPLATGDARRALLGPDAPGNRQVLDDRPPAPWRGKGDHGQGGEGMMGGKPYGRPMAMVGPDPDGLMLGQVSTSLGPFFPGLPSGLQLVLTMQGDRIGAVEAVRNWFPERGADPTRVAPDLVPALRAARGEAVRIADLERARIRSHLAWAAAFLELAGLEALSRRFLDRADDTRAVELEELFAAAERTPLRRVCRGLGHIALGTAQDLGLTGPVTRASGQPTDARTGVAGYRAFEAVTGSTGDAWARWQVRRDECLQAARLIESAGDRHASAPEAPRGAVTYVDGTVRTPSRTNLVALEHLLPGLLWSEAILAIASLDLDMAEAALR